MKFSRILSLLLALGLLAACNANASPGASATETEQNLPTPMVGVTPAPDARTAIDTFVAAWKKDDYASMYALITSASQQTVSQDDFSTRYRSAMNSLTLTDLTYQVLSVSTSPSAAQVSFKLTYKTLQYGDFDREMSATLQRENGAWKIVWDDGLVMPDLRGGGRLSADYQVPARGTIYDRKDVPFTDQTDAYALGLVPTNILPDQEPTLVSELGRLMGVMPSQILSLYDNIRDVYWYVPVGEAPASEVDNRLGLLSSLGGLVVSQKYSSRFYYYDGIAPQTVGYVSTIPKEEIDQYIRAGYSPAARVGRAGIEQWAESFLAGKTGSTLYVVKPDGTLSQLAKNDPQPAGDITLTLDRDLQRQAQAAMDGLKGSIVVIERDTGRVLAMVSSPDYDPNLFDPNNANSQDGITALLQNQDRPLVNRAAEGLYPLGSVFKVITFPAALESGTYTPDLTLECGYDWTELNDKVRHDWTWEHCQNELAATGECKTRPSGKLTLTYGLVRSCNPWFWHIGLDLYRQGRVTAIADMARAFGLGQATGIAVIPEAAGQINNPPGEIEAVNQAIGQGDVLVTPLQVADFMAAIGNGGTLYRPQLVEKETASDGTVTTLFKPEARGTLPLKPETLSALRDAMWKVVHDPRGTATYRFTNLTSVPIYGKTGTAESGNGLPHAWFAGYTDAQNPALPDIAIAVVVENQGEGSDYGAPIFKRIVETYFFGHPRSPYWWESNIGITRTPTPLGGNLTPTP